MPSVDGCVVHEKLAVSSGRACIIFSLAQVTTHDVTTAFPILVLSSYVEPW
jgi:hypothetical protein